MRIALSALLFCTILLASCTRSGNSVEDFRRRRVTLPDGTVVRAEVMQDPTDMARGMMFRKEFPEGDAMLFIHERPDQHQYWMYQVEVPLDIIWMDARGNVVEVVENAQPCKTAASQCPQYGGSKPAQVVLELPGGYGRKHGVAVGQRIQF
jgi:uncharacterized membrane protein (UPF0127 family)